MIKLSNSELTILINTYENSIHMLEVARDKYLNTPEKKTRIDKNIEVLNHRVSELSREYNII